MMRRLIILAVAALLCQALLAQSDRAGMYRVQVSVTPRQVPADGKSQARLRVEVKTARGASAPEGTQVVIHTDVGLMSLGTTGQQSTLTVRTSGGFAMLYASSTLPGTATVTVQVAGTRGVAYVDFLPEGEASSSDTRVADITGGWVGYSMELGLIEARDRACIKFGKLSISCGTMAQIDAENMILKAQDVVIQRGDAKLTGEDLYFDLAARRGVLRRFGEEKLERVYFDAIGLRPLETTWDIPDDAFKPDKREGDAWLVARSISLFVHEKIVLRHAALWVQEQKIFTFPPYWLIGLSGYTGATNTQSLGMTSDGGLALDFPFFYRVTDRATGAIRIQHGTMAGGVMSRRGWSLALSEEYRDGSGLEGAFVVSGLPRNDWGFEWRDSRPVAGDAFSYTNFAMPDHKSIFADTNFYDHMAQGRLNLRGYYDGPFGAADAYGLVGDWLMDPRAVGKGNMTYRLGTTMGMRQFATNTDPVFVNELYSELNLGERSWNKKTHLSPLLTNVYSWDTGGYHENAMRGQVRLDHQILPTFSVGLDYSAEWRQGFEPTAGFDQVLSLDARASQPDKWMSYLAASYDISNTDTYGVANFDYYLTNKWRAGVTATYYDMTADTYQDLEFSLGRMIGNREISLIYSTYQGRIAVTLGGFTLQ